MNKNSRSSSSSISRRRRRRGDDDDDLRFQIAMKEMRKKIDDMM